MRYVLDAIVAIRWVTVSPLAPQAQRLRTEFRNGMHELLAPSLFIAEVANALSKGERQRLIPSGHARLFFADILRTSPLLHAYEPLLDRAFVISSQTRSALYDCLYVALAERESCALLTADDRLFRNLQAQFPFLVSLAGLP